MPAPNETQTQPNIIVILVDDMGFSDIGCYGSEINTPNLNRLSREGVQFTQMYNCARCCPTRASLLTGLYPHQAGVGHMVNNRGIPGYQGYLNDNCVTIAEVLKNAGYRTLMSGKWHVGGPYSPNDPETWTPGQTGFPIPVQRGFDEHYGTLTGGGSYYDPPTLIHNNTLIKPEEDDYYYTDAISTHACRMIQSATTDNVPFFLYTTYTAPHWPLHAHPEDIARYENTYNKGWDHLRTTRHETLKSTGLVSDKWEISPRDEKSPAWNDAKNQDWENLRMAVYAAQIDRMDQGVGQILKTLDTLGISDNTLVMFLSDNGGCAEFLAEDGERPSKFRYNIPTRDGKNMRIGNTPTIKPGPADTFASYDLPWANASNTPFRLYKHWVHEGGIATPLLVRWPHGFSPGDHIHTPTHVIDIMATCLEASGASYPTDYNGQTVTPYEGESILPACRGENWAPNRNLYWEHEGNRAIRQDQWKLVSKYPGQWELYNMTDDRTELNDLATQNTPKIKELTAEYNAWADRSQVVDWASFQKKR